MRNTPETIDLPELTYSATLKQDIKMALCQAHVPEPILKAAKAQMAADGLTWRQVIRWAMLHYLKERNADAAAKAWGKCV